MKETISICHNDYSFLLEFSFNLVACFLTTPLDHYFYDSEEQCIKIRYWLFVETQTAFHFALGKPGYPYQLLNQLSNETLWYKFLSQPLSLTNNSATEIFKKKSQQPWYPK